MHQFMPCLIRHRRGTELAAITLGHPLLDEYLAFVAARARTNTWLAWRRVAPAVGTVAVGCH